MRTRESATDGWDSPEETLATAAWEKTVEDALDRQDQITLGEQVWGSSWGIRALDKHLLLQPGKSYVVGGIKKGGKTLFTLSTLIHNLAKVPPVNCGLFALEMSRQEIAGKVLSHVAKIDSRKIFTPYMQDRELDVLRKHAETVKLFPFHVDDRTGLSCEEIFERISDWKEVYEIPDDEFIVAVDFLQLIDLDRQKGENEASALRRTAYDLACVAKETRCAIIATAQLNNQAENNLPHIKYLEGSGGIAQCAEAILLLDLKHRRDSRYLNEGSSKSLDLIVAAQRTGESDVVIHCKADLRIGRFAAVEKGPVNG